VDDTGEKIPIARYLFPLTLSDASLKKPVFIIAEAGSNWHVGDRKSDLAMAKALITVAADSGADAVKFQTFKAETIYVPNAGVCEYLPEEEACDDIVQLFKDLSMDYSLIPELRGFCLEKGVQFMSSPFSPDDFKAVDPYVSMHKIASYEIGHLHLLELAAKSGKPLLLSTGAAVESEIAWAVETYYALGGRQLTLLQCTAHYPAAFETLHLRTIPWLRKRFKVEVGLSDHSRHPYLAPIAAVALGAQVIEKHFTLSNALPGPDHAFALIPSELKQMVEMIRQAEKVLGWEVKQVDPSEEELRAYARRGIQAIQEIRQGEKFREGFNISILRPGQRTLGIHSRFLKQIEGKKAKRAIGLGEGIVSGDW
jgi:sialic acid synthase SpsE